MIAGEIILAAGGNETEEIFWTQILVLVMLAAGVGVYSFIRKRARQVDQQEGYADYTRVAFSGGGWASKWLKVLEDKGADIFSRTAEQEVEMEKGPTLESGEAAIAGWGRLRDEVCKGRDLGSGMEVLEQDLLVRVVEETKGDDDYDVMMRKLSFKELVRREQLVAADSKALKVYAMNGGNLYGKDIQCEAMKELAGRTKLRV